MHEHLSHAFLGNPAFGGIRSHIFYGRHIVCAVVQNSFACSACCALANADSNDFRFRHSHQPIRCSEPWAEVGAYAQGQ